MNTEPSMKEKVQAAHSQERAKLSKLSFPEKIDYIWTYYKIPILGALVAIVILVSIIRSLLNPAPESVLYLLAVNSDPLVEQTTTEHMFDDYLKSLDYDPSDYEVTLNTSIQMQLNEDGSSDNPQMLQVLVTLLMAGEVDLLSADEDSFIQMAEQGYVAPLSSYMSQDEIDSYGDLVVYGKDPDTKEKTAYGVLAGDGSVLKTSKLYGMTPAIGMIYRCGHQDEAKAFMLTQTR